VPIARLEALLVLRAPKRPNPAIRPGGQNNQSFMTPYFVCCFCYSQTLGSQESEADGNEQFNG
jgi:hypothetical protein